MPIKLAAELVQPANRQESRPPFSERRKIHFFVYFLFCYMLETLDVLMSHTWPVLRNYCQKRYLEQVEVDLRWGITEDQNIRRETLKLCLDEIRDCRP